MLGSFFGCTGDRVVYNVWYRDVQMPCTSRWTYFLRSLNDSIKILDTFAQQEPVMEDPY